jgi:hypothetical protein
MQNRNHPEGRQFAAAMVTKASNRGQTNAFVSNESERRRQLGMIHRRSWFGAIGLKGA